ncbi:MAG: endonuclease/exonuclease/phosphatase family protein [Bacteroidales bacterium]|jgi:endonuclease/exonuclease/phosphatase family metal-dependent hydrolase|nr:endonuclease/exonuclease/phosphatase family protein [Bacteroidales bacterium]
MAKKSKSLNFINRIIMLANIFAVILLLLSYLSAKFSPEKLWMLAYFGLAYPIILLVNIAFVFYWIIVNPKSVLISVVAIILGYGYIGKTYQFAGKSLPKKSEDYIKVMSFNVQLFDLYNYNKDWTFNFTNRDSVFRYLRKEQPDIVCFQEYFTHDKNIFPTKDSLVKILETEYYYEYFPISQSQHNYGIATFSKFPIVNNGKVNFNQKSNNSAIFSDVVVPNGDTVRVYNMHLQSIKLSGEDLVFANDITKFTDNEITGKELKKDTKMLLRKLKHAFVKRAKQAEQVKAHMNTSPYKIIACGDFNDTPCSYATQLVSKNLKDAFVESGRGIGNSYNGNYPSFRIDYILHDKSFKSRGFTTDYKMKVSDHFPIYTYIKIES